MRVGLFWTDSFSTSFGRSCKYNHLSLGLIFELTSQHFFSTSDIFTPQSHNTFIHTLAPPHSPHAFSSLSHTWGASLCTPLGWIIFALWAIVENTVGDHGLRGMNRPDPVTVFSWPASHTICRDISLKSRIETSISPFLSKWWHRPLRALPFPRRCWSLPEHPHYLIK